MGFKDKDGKYRPTENNDSKSKVSSGSGNGGKKPDKVDKKGSDDLKKHKELIANAKEHDVSVAVIEELRTVIGEHNILIESTDDRSGYKELEVSDGSTWNLYEDYDALESHAREIIEQDLDEGGLFNQDFLDQHQEISDTDARLFGVDFGDMAVDGRDLDELKERAEQEGVDFDDPDDIEEPDRDSYKTDKSYDHAFEAWEKKKESAEEKLEAKLIDDVSSAVADDVEKRIKDNGLRSFICDDEGLCSEEDFQEQYGWWLILDTEGAVDDAISQDGAEHFISRYDGDSHKTKDGQYLVKEND